MRNSFIFIALALAACNGAAATPETEPKKARAAVTPTAGPSETLLMEWTESYSGVEQPSTRIITDAKAWKRLWQEIGKPEAPPADFEAYYAVAVFLGQRNTGGYSVRLLEAADEGEKTVVRFQEKKPKGIVIQVITYPYAVRLYPRTEQKVVVEPAK